MTAHRRPPRLTERYTHTDRQGRAHVIRELVDWAEPDPELESVDSRDVETREEAGAAGRLFATIVAIALIFAIAYFIASWLPQDSALRQAPLPSFEISPPPAGVPNASGDVAIGPPLEGARGWATYCAPTPTRCQHWGGDAHLGAVHSFTYGDDPYFVQVCGFEKGRTGCTHVLVVSFCACGDRRGEPTVIDLSPAAFAEIAPLRLGVVHVEISGPLARVPRGTLPPTDLEGP